MPKAQAVTKWKCLYCNKEFDSEEKAVNHEKEHDIIYVPLTRSDLNRLQMFIATGNKSLLTETMTRAIMKSVRSK